MTAKADDRRTERLDRTLNGHKRVTERKHKPITNIVIDNIRPNTKHSCYSFRANHNTIFNENIHNNNNGNSNNTISYYLREQKRFFKLTIYLVRSTKIISIINQILPTKKFCSVNQIFGCPYNNYIL